MIIDIMNILHVDVGFIKQSYEYMKKSWSYFTDDSIIRTSFRFLSVRISSDEIDRYWLLLKHLTTVAIREVSENECDFYCDLAILWKTVDMFTV